MHRRTQLAHRANSARMQYSISPLELRRTSEGLYLTDGRRMLKDVRNQIVLLEIAGQEHSDRHRPTEGTK